MYQRDGRAVGSAFVGSVGPGPVASLDAADLPEILLHFESRAHATALEHLDFEVPGPNATAAHHLLDRGFHFGPWVNVFMSNQPFGRFDRFIGCAPPRFL